MASGGISLGAYQAGVSYVLARALSDPAIRERTLPGHRLTIATGASAGNINAFLTALIACDVLPHTVTATANPFFDAWINIGLDKLAPDTRDEAAYRGLFGRDIGSPDHRASARAIQGGARGRAELYGPQDGLLTRAAFNAVEHHLEARLAAVRYRPDCAFLAGVTATRAAPTPLEINPGYAVPTQRYVAPLALRGTAAGLLEITNHPLATRTLGKRLALPTAAGRIGAASILSLVEASSAFPVAFAPVLLDFCDATEVLGEAPECARAHETARFTDGGVFDNVPLGMAIELAGGRPTTYLYVDPDLRRRTLTPRTPRREPAGLARLGGVLGAAFDEARRYELQGLARYRPEQVVPERFRTSTRFYDVLGDRAINFGAFIHRDLRLYDYWVGTYDGLVMLSELACGDDARCATRELVRLAYALLPARAVLEAADGSEARPTRPAPLVLHMAARERLITGALEARVELCGQVEDVALICGDDPPPPDAAWAIFEALSARDAQRRREADRGLPLSDELEVSELLAASEAAMSPPVGSEARAPYADWLQQMIDRAIDRAIEVECRDEDAASDGTLDNRLLGRRFPRWLRPARVFAAHFLTPPDGSLVTLGAPGLSGADAWAPKLFHLLPRHILWDARYGGFQFWWEPQLHLSSWLHVPLGLTVATRALDPERASLVGRASSGLGFDLPSMIVPRVQLLAFVEQPLAPELFEVRAGGEVAWTVAHVLRLAVGMFVAGAPFEADRWGSVYATVGVSEISAIAYALAMSVLP